MGYIYCITNTINNKKYVGKTLKTVEKRFKEHIHDRTKRSLEKRPLYSAMNKYGVDKFIVEILEEVKDETLLNSREVYWIEKLGTFGRNNGYNATKGGDGKQYYDYKEIIKLIVKGYTRDDISKKLGCCIATINDVARSHGLYVRKSNAYLIGRFSTDNKLLDIHFGSKRAAEFIIKESISKSTVHVLQSTIYRSAKNHGQLYGYIWKFLSLPPLI